MFAGKKYFVQTFHVVNVVKLLSGLSQLRESVGEMYQEMEVKSKFLFLFVIVIVFGIATNDNVTSGQRNAAKISNVRNGRSAQV